MNIRRLHASKRADILQSLDQVSVRDFWLTYCGISRENGKRAAGISKGADAWLVGALLQQPDETGLFEVVIGSKGQGKTEFFH